MSTEQTFQIQLTDMAHGGQAIGRHEGRVVFVPLALPGETVTVEVRRARRNLIEATLVSVDTPSPDRVPAPCPVFGQCGGCHWQHIAYPAQLELKRSIVRDALRRIGGIAEPDVKPVLGMQDPWHYRNHVHLRVNARGQPGYYALESHDIVPVEECLIAHPLLATMWQVHRTLRIRADELVLRAGSNTGERMAQLRGRYAVPSTGSPKTAYSSLYVGPSGQRQTLSGRDYYVEQILGSPYRVSSDAFFQSNTLQTERLIQVAKDYTALTAGESLLDAYCGGGLLGLSLAGAENKLIGIESSGSSVRDARENAAGRGTFWEGDLARVLQSRQPRVDAIILDPPRTGGTPEAIDALAACGASRIVYVSCDPATLARDIARFATHGYALREVQPVDMFPQTYHVETVALLARRETPESMI